MSILQLNSEVMGVTAANFAFSLSSRLQKVLMYFFATLSGFKLFAVLEVLPRNGGKS